MKILQRIKYIQETWINNAMIVSKCWQIEEMIGILKNTSSFYKFIIMHAGRKNEFIKEAQLIFKAYSITGDYHGKNEFDEF